LTFIVLPGRAARPDGDLAEVASPLAALHPAVAADAAAIGDGQARTRRKNIDLLFR